MSVVRIEAAPSTSSVKKKSQVILGVQQEEGSPTVATENGIMTDRIPKSYICPYDKVSL